MKMVKTAKKSKKKSLSKDYSKVFKTGPALPLPPSNPQWTSHGDYFEKFTLYKDSPSIASPSTSMTLNS